MHSTCYGIEIGDHASAKPNGATTHTWPEADDYLPFQNLMTISRMNQTVGFSVALDAL